MQEIMLKILKNIKNSLLILILLTANAFAASKPSSKFDGAYTYTHFCKGEESSKYEGSQFIIEDGMISNDKGGAGRWNIKKINLKLMIKEN